MGEEGGGQQREEGEKKTKLRLITLLSCYPGGQLWVVSLSPPPFCPLITYSLGLC